jgi:hypothetical protein
VDADPPGLTVFTLRTVNAPVEVSRMTCCSSREVWTSVPVLKVSGEAMGHLLGVSGQKDQARAMLGRMERLSASRYVTPYGIALVHDGLGDADAAFQWLERAVGDRAHWLVWLSLDPRFADLRGDARFAGLLRRMGW